MCIYVIFKQRSVLRAESQCKICESATHFMKESYFYAVSCKSMLGLPIVCNFVIYISRVVENTQELPKLGVEVETFGDDASTSCCRAPQPTGRSGCHTGRKVALWTGMGSIELRMSNTAVPTLIYKVTSI